jgi:hypothetical protein
VIAQRAEEDACAQVESYQGSVLLTRDLPVDELQGARVQVSCLVKTEGVVRGAQQSSTAKVHLAVDSPAGIQHFTAELVGNCEWSHQGFTADIPEGARRLVLNLGLEGCSGQAWFDRLIVRDDRRGVYPLDLSSTVNAGHSQLGIEAFPEEAIQWEGIPFQILDEIEHDGGDCIRLKGIDHPDWPGSTASRIPAGQIASSVYILHGALGGRQKSPTPCAMWTAHFVGGHDSGLSVFEGRQIGAIGRTEDHENWHVAWTGRGDSGQTITFGVTKWTLYTSEPVLALSCRAYHGASPVVLAVTVVEEPPQTEPVSSEYDEMGEASDGGSYE